MSIVWVPQLARALEEKRLAALHALALARDKDTVPTLLALACMGHSVCLTLKPLVNSCDQLASQTVRLGHVLESSRSSSIYDDHLRTIVKERFRSHRVRTLPLEAVSWHHPIRFGFFMDSSIQLYRIANRLLRTAPIYWQLPKSCFI